MPADLPGLSRKHYVWLALILLLALGLRVAYFAAARQTPGYTWEDPDGYLRQALKLVQTGSWRWTFDAATYDIEYRRHALPPGYSVFLSFFALFPGFPLTAQIAQILLAIVTVVLLFAIGREIHSPATGLIVALGYAIWIPNIFSVWSTSQEAVYLPLVLLAFLLLGRMLRTDASPARFVLPGLVFGLAALTRSMPLFFLPPAALVTIAMARNRSRAALQFAALLAGFMMLTVPYSVGLSRHFGQVTVIDTHGSIHLDLAPGAEAPTLIETAVALAKQIAATPMGFAADSLARARSLLYVNGGRLLQIYVTADTKPAAVAWKALVHAGTDLLLIAATMLAPFGAVLCRHRPLAALIAIWVLVNVGIASLGGFGGARLRAPFEPLLVALSAVVLAGGWQRPRAAPLAAAAVVAALGALAVVPQIPRSLRSWPDYGVRWPSIFSRESGLVTGAAGFNVPVRSGAAEFLVIAPDDAASRDAAIQLSVHSRGVRVDTAHLESGKPHRVRTISRGVGLEFIEVTAERTSDGSPAAVRLVVPR